MLLVTAFIKGHLMIHRKLTEVTDPKYRSNSMTCLIISMLLDPACTLHPSYCICLPEARTEASSTVNTLTRKSSFLSPERRIHNSFCFPSSTPLFVWSSSTMVPMPTMKQACFDVPYIHSTARIFDSWRYMADVQLESVLPITVGRDILPELFVFSES